MTKNKLLLGISGALLMFVCTFCLSFVAVKDYYLARNGIKVSGKVAGNADVCKSWNKSVSVLYRGEQFDIHLYGSGCRSQDFPLDQPVTLRTNKQGSKVVLEYNCYSLRIGFMLLIFALSVLVNFLMYNQYRFWKRSSAAGSR